MEILETMDGFSKAGIIGLAFFAIILIAWMMNKTYNKQIEANKQDNENQIKAYDNNTRAMLDTIKSLTMELSQMNLVTTELATKSDLHSANVLEEVKEIKKQVVAVHERINNIAEKQTGIDITTRDIKNAVEKCHK